jgi:hypothetical protein
MITRGQGALTSWRVQKRGASHEIKEIEQASEGHTPTEQHRGRTSQDSKIRRESEGNTLPGVCSHPRGDKSGWQRKEGVQGALTPWKVYREG